MDDESRQQQSMPVIEEELITGTREVKTGSVRVRKEVEHTQKSVEMPVLRDVVKVSRIRLNRVVTVAPSIREEGDILIIPVIEEELIVEKRLVLKEEIHIHRSRERSHVTKQVDLAREHAVVDRMDKEGNIITSSSNGLNADTLSGIFSKHNPIIK